MLVFSLGLILIGIMVFVGGIMWKKMNMESALSSGGDCTGAHVNLKGHGLIVDSGFEERTMRVTMEKTEGQSETILIDMCTGKILGTLTLETDAAVVE